MYVDLICVIFLEQSFLQCELEWLGVLLMGMRVHLHNNNCKPKFIKNAPPWPNVMIHTS